MDELTCVAYVDGVFYYAMFTEFGISYVKEFTKGYHVQV